MKNPIKNLVLLSGAALLSISNLSAVETDPVGYVTETISPATFNLLGLNLSSEVVAAGAFDSAVGTTLTDADADFTTALAGGGEFYVKITNGTTELGLNTGATAASATTITTTDDISSEITGGSTSYEIRRALTIADIFGAANEVELAGATAGDTSGADILWIPDGLGGYSQYYYNATPRPFPPLTVGWKGTVSGDTDASDTAIYFTSGILIEVKRAAFGNPEAGVDPGDLTKKDIVIAGSVQTDDSQVILETGFNPISRVFPGDLTLGDAMLELGLTGATAGDTSAADIVWIPDGLGGYSQYYYNATPRPFPPLTVGWKGTVSGDTDASTAILNSGVYIERKGAATMVTIQLPAGVDL